MRRPGVHTAFCEARFLALLGLVSGMVAGSPSPAGAECGVLAPDHAANRSVTVVGSKVRMRVYVSGDKIREESDSGGSTNVTLRGLPGGRTVVFDPRTGRGTELYAPRGARPPGRVVDEVLPDGTRSRIQQVESRGRWLEISRTTCRADGVMLRQSFVSLDRQGQEVVGSVTQDHIRVSPQPLSLFEVPLGVIVASRTPGNHGPLRDRVR